jgi:hypothetical protein
MSEFQREKKLESECKVDKKKLSKTIAASDIKQRREKKSVKGKKEPERFECNSIEREIFSIVQSLKLKLFLSAIITREISPL